MMEAPAFEDTVAVEEPPSFEDTSPVEEAPSFEDTSPVEAPKESGFWASFKELLSSKLALTSASVVDAITPMGKADTARMYAKAGQEVPPSLISPEQEQQNEQLVKGMRQEASVLRQASDLTFEESDPRSKNVSAQVGRGLASVAALAPAMASGVAALPLMALQGAGEAYEASYKKTEDQLRSEGVDEEEIRSQAIKAGDQAALKTAPALLLYMAGGKIAAGLAGKLVGQEATALTKGFVGAGTASVANVATSSVIRALEAKPGEKLSAAIPTIETLTADSLFGAYHGWNEYRVASRQVRERAKQELLNRGFSEEEIKIPPTEQKSEVVVEKTPEEIVVETAEPPPGAPSALSPFKPTLSGEQIINTAVQLPSGEVFHGEEPLSGHPSIFPKAPRETPIEQLFEGAGFWIQDATGNQRFSTRQEALHIAARSGQISPEQALGITKLSSELLREAAELKTKGGEKDVQSQTSSQAGLERETSQPSASAQEAAPKETVLTSDQAAEALNPILAQAVEAARNAGAVEARGGAETAASEAQRSLAEQVASGSKTIEEAKGQFVAAARNNARNQLAAEQTVKAGGGKVGEMPEDIQPEAGGPTPAQEAVRSETLDTISKAIQELPDRQMKVMERTVDGWSDREIAQELGINEAAVRKARQQARDALKEKLTSKVDWTGATDDASLIDDIRADISSIKTPQKIGILPTGSSAIFTAFDKVVEIGKEALSVSKVTDLRRGVLHWVAKVQKSFGEVSDAQKSIMRTVRDPIRRSAITDWIEAGGDISILKKQEAASKDPKLKDSYKAAQNLKPEEITLAKKIKDVFDTLHQRGVANDVLEGFKDNYVNHIWERKPQRLSFSSKSLKDSFRFSKARTFNSFFDGEQAGFRPKTKDIAKLLPVYIHEMNSVISARQLVAQLSKGKALDGRPLVSPRGSMQTVTNPKGKAYLVVPKIPKNSDVSDYKVLQDQPALTSWRWRGEDSEGNPIYVKSDLALHPEAYDRLRKALGQSEIRRWYNSEGSQLASIPKGIAKALDTTQATVKQTMLGFLSTFHVVQEGTHAVGHKINPFHVEKVDLNIPEQYDAAKHGLMLNPDRISEQNFMEGVGQTGIISRIPGIGKVADVFSNWMFHQYIPGLKWKTYRAILKRNSARFEGEMKSGEISLEDIKVLSAEQTNAAYGHLNYADLGRDPTMQHLMQLTLLAPDFLEARGRFAAQAAKAALGSKSGREQFTAIALLAVSQFVASQVLNKILDGKFHFDHPFEVMVGDRRYTLRSVPEDIFNMIRDTRRFVYGRINPVIGKGSIQLITGQNYRGEKVDADDTVAEIVAQAIPLTVQSIPGVRSLTESGRNQPISPLEQFAGSMGLRISRYSPISEIYQLASKWEDEQGIPRDKGSYPVSKYQQLRYALEDGDEEKARKEIEKLGETLRRDKLISGFEQSITHPFTQSQTMDVKFAKTLKPADYEKYKLAKAKRKDILRRFYRVMRQP
jgi:RNA polymerase sigma factor (sigma-70 family)